MMAKNLKGASFGSRLRVCMQARLLMNEYRVCWPGAGGWGTRKNAKHSQT